MGIYFVNVFFWWAFSEFEFEAGCPHDWKNWKNWKTGLILILDWKNWKTVYFLTLRTGNTGKRKMGQWFKFYF